MGIYIYALPLRVVFTMIVAGILLWGLLRAKWNGLLWRNGNLCLLILSFAGVLYLTIFDRSVGSYGVVLRPFAMIERAHNQPELYREMLMNIFLFFPLGLTLSNVLPQEWSRWGRIALTTLFGCLLSIGVEFAQYRFSLGMVEADDVICNTLGASIGACSLCIART